MLESPDVLRNHDKPQFKDEIAAWKNDLVKTQRGEDYEENREPLEVWVIMTPVDFSRGSNFSV